MWRSILASTLLGLFIANAAHAAPQAPQPATHPAFSAERLRAAALDLNPTTSALAIDRLQTAGDAGRPVLLQVLPTLISRDSDQVSKHAAAVGDLAALRQAEKSLDELRKPAWENPARLNGKAQDPTIRAAHRNYDSLAAAYAKVVAVYARQSTVVEDLERYRQHAAVWREVGGSVAASAEAAIPKFESDLAKALRMTLGEWKQLGEGPLIPPKDGNVKGIWLYLTARRIEAYNRSVDSSLHPQEAAQVRVVNAYREMLGILPYEIDPRLTQSARRHTREMIELGYFGHFSPATGDRTCFQRMRGAGYEAAAAENLSMGRWTGEEAFWRLFDSSSHHKTIVMPWQTTIGVGKWENAWTQNFGFGPRLMLATPEQRAAVKVAGDILKPQEKELLRNKPPDLTKLKTYDEEGKERAIVGPP
jgi:hypothetical protein